MAGLALLFLSSVTRRAAADGPAPKRGFVVRVYDTAITRDSRTAHASDVARGIFQESGVELTWIVCSNRLHQPSTADKQCWDAVLASDLIVRIMHRSTVSSIPLILGCAHVDPETRTGVVASV